MCNLQSSEVEKKKKVVSCCSIILVALLMSDSRFLPRGIGDSVDDSLIADEFWPPSIRVNAA